jgi:hypothetical protein
MKSYKIVQLLRRTFWYVKDCEDLRSSLLLSTARYGLRVHSLILMSNEVLHCQGETDLHATPPPPEEKFSLTNKSYI